MDGLKGINFRNCSVLALGAAEKDDLMRLIDLS